MISDLMSFSALLILAMCLLDNTINFDVLVKLIEISTCLLEGLLEVILSFGKVLPFLGLLIVLYTSLILRISSMLDEDAYVYDYSF